MTSRCRGAEARARTRKFDASRSRSADQQQLHIMRDLGVSTHKSMQSGRDWRAYWSWLSFLLLLLLFLQFFVSRGGGKWKSPKQRTAAQVAARPKKKALEGRVERERETQVLSLYAKELSVAVRIVVKVEGSARVLCCLCASVFFCKWMWIGINQKISLNGETESTVFAQRAESLLVLGGSSAPSAGSPPPPGGWAAGGDEKCRRDRCANVHVEPVE